MKIFSAESSSSDRSPGGRIEVSESESVAVRSFVDRLHRAKLRERALVTAGESPEGCLDIFGAVIQWMGSAVIG